MRNVLTAILVVCFTSLFGQQLFLPIDHDEVAFTEMYLGKKDVNFHTSVKPFIYKEVLSVVNLDSIDSLLTDTNRLYLLPTSNWAKALRWCERKLMDEDLVSISKPNFQLRGNLLLDLNVGRETKTSENYWNNTRGFWLSGQIGEKIFFESSMYENQAILLPYIREYADVNYVIPGQGRFKLFREGKGADWGFASGAVGYRPNNYFTITMGHGRNFLGEGYRSLLLSDNTFNYPFIKVETNIWNIKYVNLWAQLNHIGFGPGATADQNYAQKFLAVHYLSWNATKRFNISLYESISWLKADKGFDWQYMNPIIFLRPVEWQNGSQDNVLLGASAKYKLTDNISLYGQVVLDDLNIQEWKKQDGYWGNKYGGQIGIKAFNLFNVYGLSAQAEYNAVRPFTYSHFDSLNAHTHMNQPLAHPLGANFQEINANLRYKYKRHKFGLKIVWAEFGTDTAGVNHGGDPFFSYNTNKVIIKGDNSDFGHSIGQGLASNLNYMEVRYAYLVNPRARLYFEIGARDRTLSKENLEDDKTRFIFIGVRTTLNNFYNDFF